jgi:hypothetical protein
MIIVAVPCVGAILPVHGIVPDITLYGGRELTEDQDSGTNGKANQFYAGTDRHPPFPSEQASCCSYPGK